MLLNAGNVGACGETLVLDTCGGLVLGSVTHRMGGFGRICNGYVGHNPTGMEVLMNMNLEDKHFDCIVTRRFPSSSRVERRAQGPARRKRKNKRRCRRVRLRRRRKRRRENL